MLPPIGFQRILQQRRESEESVVRVVPRKGKTCWTVIEHITNTKSICNELMKKACRCDGFVKDDVVYLDRDHTETVMEFLNLKRC